MTYAWYLLAVVLAAGWVFADAPSRMASRLWCAAVLAGGPFGLAAYLALRPLRDGESRDGGTPWQLFSKFVVVWTGFCALAGVSNELFRFSDRMALAAAWALGALPALAVGLALKRSEIERGPTGRLRALARWQPIPERTPDGRCYICRECGKHYPVGQMFCDGCGAWPGQSG
jgi:hypothetical protein